MSITKTNTHTKDKDKSFQEKVINVYRLTCPLAHETHFHIKTLTKANTETKTKDSIYISQVPQLPVASGLGNLTTYILEHRCTEEGQVQETANFDNCVSKSTQC